MSGSLNAEAHKGMPDWLKSMIGPVVAMALGGTVVGIQAREQLNAYGTQLAEMSRQVGDKLEALDRATRDRLDTVTLTNNERTTALSARLNSQDSAIRDASIAVARQQEQLGSLKSSIEERGKQRDSQLESVLERLATLERGQADDRVRSARIEAALDQVLDLLQPSRRLPGAQGR